MPPPEGTPWWAWLIVGVAGALGTIVVALIQQHRKVDAVVEQVKNTHDTNLRTDLDEAKQEARLARESSHRLERFVEDLLKTIRSMEASMDRREGLHAQFEHESAKDRADIRQDLAEIRAESQADRRRVQQELERYKIEQRRSAAPKEGHGEQS
jgi:CHASE1-domain containing sensor protein